MDDAKLECFIPGGVEGVAGYRFGCAIGTVHGASSYLSMKVAGGVHINDARNLIKLMTYIVELHETSPSVYYPYGRQIYMTRTKKCSSSLVNGISI